ncbi:Zinc finger, RING-type domain and Bcr-Abl oncoprotein oligomerisation domain-containing protein [Strongyloides ratti]|uniref:Zinc finger, RING-type domain and Bcr-Abl oncoprotein oligomerisation domain-containing protein n=1 Tax=Strongyloides ratti TaxID=34506 RepID=A0A090L1Q1_STRRB|nr:Zinc finger, RING-type domain and Bcr-Abl oncoprotein oligomerisation domain-containing protein [Strongyloides ratti]CEF63701.1 Zinc finger, RING-type domain and Bcr-Abl oncoprotein oligomerisation domain-containing protein [Strongyloides ratti]
MVFRDIQNFSLIQNDSNSFAIPSKKSDFLLLIHNPKSLYYFFFSDPSKSKVLNLEGSFNSFCEEFLIFDFFYLKNDKLVLLIKSTNNRHLYIVSGDINFEDGIVYTDDNETVDTGIICDERGRKCCVTFDNIGPVIIDYPVIQGRNNFPIKLFHISEYFETKVNKLQIIIPEIRPENEVICSNPFISNNYIYFFIQMSTQILAIPITSDNYTNAENHFKAKILNTYSEKDKEMPSKNICARDILSFDDFLLVYCYQNLEANIEKPSLWKLNFNSLVWTKLEFVLSHHYPCHDVKLRSYDNRAFLVGICSKKNCNEKNHFYEFDLSILLNDNKENKLINNLDNKNTITSWKSKSASNPNFTINSSNNKINRDESLTISTISLDSGSCSSEENNLSQNDKSIRKQVFPLNWSKKMSLEGVTRVTEQIKQAKEMGYDEELIFQALQENSLLDDVIIPYSSTSALVEKLINLTNKQNNNNLDNTKPKIGSIGSSYLTTSKSFSENTRPKRYERSGSRLTGRTTRYHTLGNFERSPIGHSNLLTSSTSLPSTLSRSNLSLSNQNLLKTAEDSITRLYDTCQKEKEHYLTACKENVKTLEDKLNLEKQHRIRLQTMCEEKDETIRRLRDSNLKYKNFETRLTRANKSIEDWIAKYQTSETEKIKIEADCNRRVEKLIKEKELLQRKIEVQTSDRIKIKDLTLENGRLKEKINQLESRIELFSNKESYEAQLNDLKVENYRLTQQINSLSLCLCCCTSKPDTIFLPCWHLLCCQNCSTSLFDCPICRTSLQGKVKVFLG